MSRRDYYTVRGNVDDILESKEVVKYEEVFREYREGALVLVEGRPGSGKTTLVHKVTRDWATGRKVLQEANWVFLITLRLLNFSGKDKLTDLLNLFYEDELNRTAIECKLSKSGGKGACFIIDGLDEYQIEKKKDSVINQLINKKCLPFSMVIVASRPVATRELKKTCTKRVEVIGFSKDQIYAYVETYNKDTCDMISKLKVYLGQHPNVLHMCYLPVHASMICYLFSQLEGNIPHTETQIYEKFIIATLLRHMTRNEEQQQLKSLKDLCGEEEVKFRSTCKLAFDMIIESKQVVRKSDAQVSLLDSSFLGLLTVERTFREYGCEDLYTFQHLTCQEYLVAFHVSQLNDEELEELIASEASDEVSMYNVWKLYCGLVESGKSIGVVKKVFEEEFYKLLAFQCAFESQQVGFCDYVVGEGVLSFVKTFITSSDFIALGYVISNASRLVSKLCFVNCKWDNDGVMAFSSMVSKDRLNFIKYLEAYGSSTGDDFKALNGLLGQLPFLEELDIRGTVIGRSGVEYLTSDITIPKLHVLKIAVPLAPSSHPEDVLSQLTFGSQNIKQIHYSPSFAHFRSFTNLAVWRKILCSAFGFQVFQDSGISWVHLYNSDAFSSLHQERFSCCTETILVNCGINDEGAEILANRLNTSVLENLVLDFNKISDSGSVALASCIARCSVVREISIQCNSIGDSGAIAFADALVHCSSLRRLDLQGNNLGDEGAVAIVKAIESLPSLDLYLHNVNITIEGIERVLEHRASTKIRAMVFGSSWDSISEAGIDALRSALKCETIPALRISETNIYNIETLVAELQHVRNIRGLEFHDIPDDTVPTLCRIVNYLCNIHQIECRILGSFSSTSAELLSDSLKTCKSLHSVTLDDIYADTEQFSLLNADGSLCSSSLDALKCCSNIHSLSLPLCNIGSVGISLLVSAHKSWVNLHTLNLHKNTFGSDGAQDLSKVLVHYKSLRCLDLSDNEIGDSGAVALAEGLKGHTRLIELKLGYNNITSASIAALIQVIRCNHLQHLDLSGCYHLSEVVAALVDVKDTLQTLNLGDNGIGVDGIKSLSVGVKNCTQLVQLSIRGNWIDSRGLEYLGKGLRHCTKLQLLDLGNTVIKSDGVPAILGIMESCRFLQELDLSRNDIGVDDAAVLIKGWQNQSVLTLNLASCFDDPHQLALVKGESCCNSCDHLLELYCNNDYVHIILDHFGRSIPKVISAELI